MTPIEKQLGKPQALITCDLAEELVAAALIAAVDGVKTHALFTQYPGFRELVPELTELLRGSGVTLRAEDDRLTLDATAYSPAQARLALQRIAERDAERRVK